MKTFIFSAVLLASAFCITSCSEDDESKEVPKLPETKVSLSVTGGEAITVDGADVTKSITITASGKSEKDIEVTLESDAQTGQVAFPVNPVIIKAGKTLVSASVTFTLEGFPIGTAEKSVGITIASNSEQAVIDNNKTATFTVKGKDAVPVIPPVASISANGKTSISVNGTDVTETINITLDKAATKDVTIQVAATEGATLSAPSVTIANGKNSGTVSITFPTSIYTTDVKKNVTVTATSADITFAENKSSITYQVNGPEPAGKQDLGIYFIPETSVEVTNDFWIYFRKEEGKTQEGNITLKYTITGFDTSELWISGSGIIGIPENSGWREASGSILIKPADDGIMNINIGGCPISKKGRVTFTTDDATFKNNTSSASIDINYTKQ